MVAHHRCGSHSSVQCSLDIDSHFPPDSVNYWGSCLKYRKSCVCALSSLGAGAAAGRRCCVRLGAWVPAGRVPLQGAAPGCLPLLCAAAVRWGAWVLALLANWVLVTRCRVPLLCALGRLVPALGFGIVYVSLWVQ